MGYGTTLKKPKMFSVTTIRHPLRLKRYGILLCLALLCALMLSSTAEPDAAVDRSGLGLTTLTNMNVCLAFAGRGVALVWSEEHGILKTRFERSTVRHHPLRTPQKKMDFKGSWLAGGIFKIVSSELRDEPVEIPPVRSVEALKESGTIGRCTVEGTVEHVIDRGYLIEVILDHYGTRVGVIYRGDSARDVLYPGARLRVTGYTWNPFKTQTQVSLVLSCSKVEDVELMSEERLARDEVVYENMAYLGMMSTRRRLFRGGEPEKTLCLSFSEDLLVDWDFTPNHLHDITVFPHGNSHNGVIAARSSHLVVYNKSGVTLPLVPFDPKGTQLVGSLVSFLGRLSHRESLENGDLWITLEDLRNRGNVLVIFKAFHINWPGLALREGAHVKVTGMYQNMEEGSGLPEIVLQKRRDKVYVVRESKIAQNWIPILLVMAGGLAFCVLWVTILRRSVAQRTRQARESEAKLMAVYQSVPHGIVAVDHRQQVFGINQAMSTMFGLEGVFDKSPFANVCEAVGDKMRLPNAWRDFWTHPDSASPTREFTIADSANPAENRSIEIHVEPIVDQKADGTLWIFRDLTERRALEGSLAQSRKLEAVGRLTGGIAHDFNNLLTGVTGNLSMLEMELREGTTTPEQTMEYVQGASTAAEHAAELVRRLLDYSKQTPLKVRNSCCNEIVMNLYDFLRHSIDARVELDMQLSDDLLATRVDPVKIEQVLMNLVINSVDAMPEGGKVTITTENVQDPAGGDAVSICVSDNGCGISPELMEKIYDPYFTTKAEDGNGLGLPTALAIVEQHGGKMDCHSAPGVGTTFSLTLPANQEPCDRLKAYPDASIRDESTPARPDGKPKVVAIDDDPSVLRLVRTMVTRLGCEVACFPNGEEAVNHIRSVDGNIDLVISDNSMPVMDGMQTYEEVRAAYPTIPFIVCSGYLIDLSDYGKRADGCLPEAFIEKPLHVKTFSEVIQNVLAEPRVGVSGGVS